MISAGVIGGSGYTGGELIRLVLNHPQVDLKFVFSPKREGIPLSDVHLDLLGTTSIEFTSEVDTNIDVVFVCLGHGNSLKFLEEYKFSSSTIIIDLSNDFRLKEDRNSLNRTYVYGLPEFQKKQIKGANAIANPGCFATAIQLALLPLADKKLLKSTVHINAVTGSTGAGVQLSPTSHFSWRNNNFSWYKPFTHQHLGEIQETLSEVQGESTEILFLPQRGDFTRGIFTTAYTKFEGSLEDAFQLYKEFYALDPFTHISRKEIALKQVISTNNCFIHLHLHQGFLLVTSIIDNLIKGASGQALQNLNLIMGWEEDLGLNLKANVF